MVLQHYFIRVHYTTTCAVQNSRSRFSKLLRAFESYVGTGGWWHKIAILHRHGMFGKPGPGLAPVKVCLLKTTGESHMTMVKSFYSYKLNVSGNVIWCEHIFRILIQIICKSYYFQQPPKIPSTVFTSKWISSDNLPTSTQQKTAYTTVES